MVTFTACPNQPQLAILKASHRNTFSVHSPWSYYLIQRVLLITSFWEHQARPYMYSIFRYLILNGIHFLDLCEITCLYNSICLLDSHDNWKCVCETNCTKVSQMMVYFFEIVILVWLSNFRKGGKFAHPMVSLILMIVS